MTAVAGAPDRGARLLRTAARGVVLTGVAVVVGIVLLSVVNGSGSPTSGSAGKAASSTTSTTGGTTASTGKPVAQIKVAVFNASGVSGAANTTANKLRGLGYAIVAVTNSTTQTGTTVACKVGTVQAQNLAKNVSATATVGVFPSPEPASANAGDCIVTIGK
jgi:LytR cell envelope-related transcriptional attenuator